MIRGILDNRRNLIKEMESKSQKYLLAVSVKTNRLENRLCLLCLAVLRLQPNPNVIIMMNPLIV